MDSAWFKTQLRRAGINSGDLAEAISRDRAVVSRILNGHQRITVDQAKAFAEALGVDLPILLEKSGLAEPAVAKAFTAGFSDGDAAPWIPSSRPDDSGRLIAQALGAERPGIDVWRVKGMSMALAGYMPGDHILVDTNQAERVRSGDVVIAQQYLPNGSATTLLRRFEPPVLVAASIELEDRRVHVVDGVNVLIRGKVIASWRAGPSS